MPRYPGAVWRPISKSRRFLARPLIVCIHTMVGSLAGTDSWFRRNAVDSHFGLGNTTDGPNDGAVWQWVDTSRIAFANYLGNDDVISIETADGGNPNNPWSPKALDALVDLLVWLCRTHNVRSILINGNTPGSAGLAYHRQGCDHSSSYRPRGWPYDQWRVPHGVRWSTAVGKVCPGDVRIRQWVDVVLPRVKAKLEGTEGETVMSWTDDLSRNGKAPQITGLVDNVLSDSASRRADGLLGYGAAAFYELRSGRPERRVWTLRNPNTGTSYGAHVRLMDAKIDAILAAQQGCDTDAILRGIDEKLKPIGERLDVLHELLEQHADGTLDAEDVVRRIGELLSPKD